LIKHFIVKFLLPDTLKPNQDLLSKFAEFTQPDDVIITFNYDLLLEQALWKAGLWSPQDGYLLGEFNRNLKYDHSKLFETQVPIIKLHGSINWHEAGIFQENIQVDLSHPANYEPYFEGLNIDFGVRQRPREFYYDQYLIAPTFMKTYRSKYEVHLVRAACDAISKSDEIYAIGYSFPDADSFSSFLLAQIPAESKIFIVDKNADEIATTLSKSYGLKRNNIKNEQSNIGDWIGGGFKFSAYENYLETQHIMNEMLQISKNRSIKHE